MKWRKRLWRDGWLHGAKHYWQMQTPLGKVLCAHYTDGWVAAINYTGTDADVEIGWGDTDEIAKRSAEKTILGLSKRLAKAVSA